MERQYDSTSAQPLPEITQYGIKLPFRVAIVSQTDSGKTHSIMHSWLGGKISYWKPNEHEAPEHAFLQHCLFCSNGGMSNAKKGKFGKAFRGFSRTETVSHASLSNETRVIRIHILYYCHCTTSKEKKESTFTSYQRPRRRRVQ